MVYIHNKSNVSCHYISREMYDRNWLLYPSAWSEAYQTKIIMESLKSWKKNINELDKFNYVFKT